VNKIVELGAPKDHIIKLPMGVDLGRFAPPEKRVERRDKLQLLSVGRLVDVKGFEYGLMAVRRMRDQGVELNYRIEGDGPLRHRLETLTDKLGIRNSVEFLGARMHREIDTLYRSADVFISPGVVTASNEEESQSVVLAEAQASGDPVVATRVGGIAETVYGKTGLLVRPRDPNALVDAIRWLAQHPEAASRMGEAGREHVQKFFNLQRLNDQLLSLYLEISSRWPIHPCAAPT
jgi:colanic acid/amylovoran biosynthesis glycosyltransferase